MTLIWDRDILMLLGGVVALLILGSLAGRILDRRVTEESGRAVVINLNARVRAWWVMVAVFVLALATGGIGSVVLFGLLSFVALRELITLTPTRRADHRTLFWAFFVFVPVQYGLVYSEWYGLFAIFIPVYAFLFVPVRSALAGDTQDFLARTAKIQWGLMLAVYCVSHAPALLMLQIPGYAGEGAKLLLYLVIVVQLSDVLQYVFGKTLGRHRIVPQVSPNKTWEGFLGGVGAATLIGAGLWWVTPFSPWAAVGIALLINLAGFAGGLCLSAIKRDLGVKDFGTLIEGHGGVMDRIDSLCFAAPLFFHVVRYFYT
ncbi:phosphatidate cytidylyltransferase [Thiobaca trueperi]|uniref:Phosphatidate cytidylyltransferase n=1 Tax=Thiobaca trueperi TaxID=127458 RepID=A0A4R3N5W2_9GAMM|nr:phosphatidate cytidylyltransferase [Thiobaca trueperi]TCT22199.1 phosphatidate cytidylyltransferase [Thiobaca trueperi]